MPAVSFKVTWPDGEQSTYYSPSTIIHQHFEEGVQYSQAEFEQRIHDALNAASERVYERFGYYCTAASGELEKITHKLSLLSEQNIQGMVKLNQFT